MITITKIYFIAAIVKNVELVDEMLYFIVKSVIVVCLKVLKGIISVCKEELIMIV